MDILQIFLSRYDLREEELLEKAGVTPVEIAKWQVIYYPDELLFAISQATLAEISVILFELFQIENAGAVRRVASDYGLIQALESEVTYLFIPHIYRQKQSKLMTDILIEKEIFEPDLGPLGKYNFIGKEIYRSFLENSQKSSEFDRISPALAEYFVLVNDDGGTILCHHHFAKAPGEIKP